MTEAEEVIQFIREAAVRGDLSVADLIELRDYARMILDRRVENPQTSGEEEQTAAE